MTWIADLSPCTYMRFDSPRLLAIGWLGEDNEYLRGPVESALHTKLGAMREVEWATSFRGLHECELCEGLTSREDGSVEFRELFVPGDGVVFVAPYMITHYIDVHRYQPPPEFIAAVMGCPDSGSDEYFALIEAICPGLVATWRSPIR